MVVHYTQPSDQYQIMRRQLNQGTGGRRSATCQICFCSIPQQEWAATIIIGIYLRRLLIVRSIPHPLCDKSIYHY